MQTFQIELTQITFHILTQTWFICLNHAGNNITIEITMDNARSLIRSIEMPNLLIEKDEFSVYYIPKPNTTEKRK